MIFALSKEGYCVAKYKRTTKYQDSIKTLCDHYIILPHDMTKKPNTNKHKVCLECIEKLGKMSEGQLQKLGS